MLALVISLLALVVSLLALVISMLAGVAWALIANRSASDAGGQLTWLAHASW